MSLEHYRSLSARDLSWQRDYGQLAMGKLTGTDAAAQLVFSLVDSNQLPALSNDSYFWILHSRNGLRWRSTSHLRLNPMMEANYWRKLFKIP